VRAPEGNGCAERFIRTLKENLLWVRSFDTVEELRATLLEFRDTYNATWLIERHGFRPPSAVRQDQLSTAALAAQAATRCLTNRGRYNYGQRYRAGKPISTSRAEGAVNHLVNARMNKRRQMRWSPRGAHRVLQVRAAVLDGRFGQQAIQLAA
jgi:hypothetical protein